MRSVQENEKRDAPEREKIKCMVFMKGLKEKHLAAELKQRLNDKQIVTLEKAGKCVYERLKDFEDMKEAAHTRTTEILQCCSCGPRGHTAKTCYNSGKNWKEGIDRPMTLEKRLEAKGTMNRREGRTRSFEGRCWTCGMVGHPFFACSQKQQNNSDTAGKGQNVREIHMETLLEIRKTNKAGCCQRPAW